MELDKEKFIQSIRNCLADGYMETGRLTSLDKAAIKIGISKPTLSRINNGKMFDVPTFLKVCNWLQMTPNDFIKNN